MIEDLLIVAAGTGSRLRAKGDLKPLVEICGTSLIERALASAFNAGLARATVVTGYNAPVLEDHLDQLVKRHNWRIETVHNAEYQHPNGLSVLKARNLLSGPFCLAMCDHLVAPSLYRTLIAGDRMSGEVALAVDTVLGNGFVDLDDVTKVRYAGRHILEIGKEIPVYNAFDTGIFAADPALFDAIAKSGRERGDYSISGGMTELALAKKAVSIDVGGEFWIDVDSPAMYDLATSWLTANQSLAV